MPGFAFLGKFALGQVGPPSIIVPGVTATGVAGVISASTGAVPGVSAKGSAGNLIPSTLSINPHRLLPTWSDAREPRHGIEWENPQLFSVFVARKTMAPLTYLDCKILA